MTIQYIEESLNIKLNGNTIIFSFPGIGIGNNYPELSGCTLEVKEMELIAKTFKVLGITFIGISTDKLPDKSNYIKYINIPDNINSFKYIDKNNKLFIDRFTLLITDNNIIEKKIKNATDNSFIVKQWIGNLLYKDLGINKTTDRILKEHLSEAKGLSCGADSIAILSLNTEPKTILKIGNTRIINNELDLIDEVNYFNKNLFPEIINNGKFKGYRWYQMLQIESEENIKSMIFNKNKLNLNWVENIYTLLNDVKLLYKNSIKSNKCLLSLYHYQKRIPKLLVNESFIETFEKIDILNQDINNLMNKNIRVNDFQINNLLFYINHIKSKSEDTYINNYSCIIHGDLHLENILYKNDKYFLIDPRLQWDNEPVHSFGRGDPIYDMSTLLHSISCMNTILDYNYYGKIKELIKYNISDTAIDIIIDDIIIENIQKANIEFLEFVPKFIPLEFLVNYKHKLFLGVANALFGWLKYNKFVSSKEIWLLIYGIAMYYIDLSYKNE